MGGKIAIYNLGSLGVDVVKSPVHIDDGAFTSAQNAQVDSVAGVGGIRKRDGMSKLNAVAMAGSGQGIIGLPLPDLSALTRHFYAAIDDNGGAATFNFRTSTNGTTWTATIAGLVYPQQSSQLGTFGASYGANPLRWAVLNRKFYYPGNDYTAATTLPTIHVWDGTNDYKLCTLPDNPKAGTHPLGILSLVPYSATQLLVTTYDGNTAQGRGRALILDVTTGQMVEVGAESDLTAGLAVAPVIWQGKIWYPGYNLNGGVAAKVYSARVGDTSWVLDNTSASTAVGYIIGATVFLGELYVAHAADAGASAIIRKRTNDAVWSTVYTSGSVTAKNYVGPFIVSQDALTIYCFENTEDVTGSGTTTALKQRIMKSTDGAAWSTEYDVGQNLNNNFSFSGLPLLDTNGDIYWPVMGTSHLGKTLKRTLAGTWSVADGNTNHLADGNPMRGTLGPLGF